MDASKKSQGKPSGAANATIRYVVPVPVIHVVDIKLLSAAPIEFWHPVNARFTAENNREYLCGADSRDPANEIFAVSNASVPQGDTVTHGARHEGAEDYAHIEIQKPVQTPP